MNTDNNKHCILFVDNSTRCFYIFRIPIARAFIALGYDVYVASPAPYDYYKDEIVKCGIHHITYDIGSKFSILDDFKLCATLFRIYKEINPQFVFHYTIKPNIYGSIAAKLLKIKSLAVVPGTGSVFQKRGIVSKIVELLYHFAFQFPQKVWVLNNDDLNAFLQRRIISQNRIEILPGEGVNSEYFNTTIDYKKNKKFVFLYMGRMLREKGVEYLANASALLKKRGINSFEVHLLGLVDGLSNDVISETEIRNWESQGVVKYLGSVPDVRKNIEAADCIILPSFYGEGVPRSLMEASSMKRPILTTDNVGCRDIVENGINGILCKSQDVDDLAAKMLYMIELPESELRQMGENGRNIVLTKFEESVIVNRYIIEVNRIFQKEDSH